MSTDTILDHLYDTFGPAEEGEDYAFGLEQDQVDIATSQAVFWGEVNDARAQVGIVAWEGLVTEGYYKSRAETDPNLLADRLLELAAIAAAFADSVQRQTNALNEPLVEDEEPEQEEE